MEDLLIKIIIIIISVTCLVFIGIINELGVRKAIFGLRIKYYFLLFLKESGPLNLSIKFEEAWLNKRCRPLIKKLLASLIRLIVARVHKNPEEYMPPPNGYERIMGWNIYGEKIFDSTQEIDHGFHCGSFSAIGYANQIEEKNGIVMAWIKPKTMNIWSVELVKHNAGQHLVSI